jgi:hypothetical protein
MNDNPYFSGGVPEPNSNQPFEIVDDVSLPDALEEIGRLIAQRARYLAEADTATVTDGFEDRLGASTEAGVIDPEVSLSALAGFIEILCVSGGEGLAQYAEEATRNAAMLIRTDPPKRKVWRTDRTYPDFRDELDHGPTGDVEVEDVHFSPELIDQLGAMVANLERRPYLTTSSIESCELIEEWTASAAVTAYLSDLPDGTGDEVATLVALPVVLFTNVLTWLDVCVLPGLSNAVLRMVESELVPSMRHNATQVGHRADDLGEAA